jgi:XTP/dITP diphosphohydrolase
LTQLIFATNNTHKVAEIQAAFGETIAIQSLQQAGIDTDIEEPFATLEENALQKCRVIHQLTGQACFGEDTGLFVPVLNGAPGVRSARYAGEQRSDAANISLLLQQLLHQPSRSAYFKTVIALIWNKTEYLFEGVCPGEIIAEKRGVNGFGYDPIFIPAGSTSTFAEMTMAEKALFSHRKKAMQQLVAFLQHQRQEW